MTLCLVFLFSEIHFVLCNCMATLFVTISGSFFYLESTPRTDTAATSVLVLMSNTRVTLMHEMLTRSVFFDLLQGLKAGSLHFPGTASSYNGDTALVREVEPLLYNYKNETAWRENTDKVMSWFRDQDLDFVSMYFGEPDGTGHKYGPNSPEIREMVNQVDRTVGYIRETAKNYGLQDELNIIITADHGMSHIYRNGLVEEITLFKIPGFSFKDLSFFILDYGPSGMLLPKPGMTDKVYNALKGAHPHLHVYKKEQLPERMHFSKNDRILPIILWADSGYVLNGVSGTSWFSFGLRQFFQLKPVLFL